MITGTCGKACQGYEVRLWKQENPDVEAGPGEVGEIGGRGGVLMLGYFNNQSATENSFNSSGWFLSGDLGRFDEDGNLRIVGRKKDLIIRGGHNIHPAHIEEYAHRHPSVKKAAAFGVADERLGEKVCLALICQGTVPSADEILHHLAREGLSKFDMPEFFAVVDELPDDRERKDPEARTHPMGGQSAACNRSPCVTARTTHDRSRARRRVRGPHDPQALGAQRAELRADRPDRAGIGEAGRSKARALIVTGEGEKAFCAGADIKELQRRELAAQREGAELGQAVFALLDRLPIPSIALVNGFAFGGGCELALACTLRLALPNAKFGLPEVKLGLIPGYGGTQRLPRLVGVGRALEMVMTGRTVGAEEALAMGLVNRIVQPPGLAAAKAYAREFTGHGLRALQFAREAVQRAHGPAAARRPAHGSRPVHAGLPHRRRRGRACRLSWRSGRRSFSDE